MGNNKSNKKDAAESPGQDRSDPGLNLSGEEEHVAVLPSQIEGITHKVVVNRSDPEKGVHLLLVHADLLDNRRLQPPFGEVNNRERVVLFSFLLSRDEDDTIASLLDLSGVQNRRNKGGGQRGCGARWRTARDERLGANGVSIAFVNEYQVRQINP